MREIYSYRRMPRRRKSLKRLLIILVALGAAFLAYKYLVPNSVERAINRLQFNASVSEIEKQTIQEAIKNQSLTYKGEVSVSVKTSYSSTNNALVLSAYVPVTNFYSTKQAITKTQLAQSSILLPSSTNEPTKTGIATLLNVEKNKLVNLSTPIEKLSSDKVALIPVNQMLSMVKLLKFDNAYYLDSFNKGAIFRQAVFSGESAGALNGLKLNKLETKKSTLKINMTGVTALTRDMMKKLNSVKDAGYFSAKIGKFLANADITHVSNEVSFKPGCTYSTSVFCSRPAMIETLKDSGIDLVELTGNHNNDTGRQYNTDTIKLYRKLGWKTFGGGLNEAEAAKPFVASKKQSKIAFLGYNYPDSPSGGAIATTTSAGANSFDFGKIKSDIASAKTNADFIVVNVQFWECYAYPDSYEEFPECDLPIGSQKSVFRKIADLGADMVIGTQAHQPQTYEAYRGKPIYYGLGNLYFEQTNWPGTERGIILTHYFVKGKLIQTKLTPTVYDEALQTRLMNSGETNYLLERLKTARKAL